MMPPMTPDMVNGAFEALAGVFVLDHSRHLLRDKQVKGVSLKATIFFTSWGFWNLFYYPNLHQLWSFAGGVVVVAANFIWLMLMIYYLKHPGGTRLPKEPSNG